jgi:Cof subfamily protein (haloacid dehalogenase superfamily)
MKKKIFFTDLDGTLLNDNKELCAETSILLRRLLTQGHYLVLSSGRPLPSIKIVKDTLNLPDKNVYLAGYNGGVIYECFTGKIISEKRVPFKYILPIFEETEKMDIYCQTYSDDTIVCKHSTPELELYQKVTKAKAIFTDDILGNLEKPPYKLLAISALGRKKLEQLQKILAPLIEPELQTLFSSGTLLEIFPANSGKGSTVYELCSYLDIPITNTLAAGDEENDISMLKAAAYSVAMCNGNEAIKRHATYVSESDNNSDGLAPYLKDFFDLK